jgi:peptide/nickel transport system substrate-binding protein
MKILAFGGAAALLLSLQAGAVQAQTTLRIGLPRIRTCSIRRWRAPMSAASCSRRSATSCSTSTRSSTSCRSSRCPRDLGRRQGVTIKLRPGVKFHDGEPFDAEAAKFSLERHMTMPGSFRKPELAAVDHVDVVDPLTIKLVLKTPFSPLIAQLTDRAGMMVSPKAAKEGRQVRPAAGLRRPLQVRRARAAGPHRVREIRRLLEQGQRLHRPHRLSADRRRHGAARQPEIRRLDLIERVLRPTSRTCAPTQAQARRRDRARLSGHHHQRRQGQGQGAAQPVAKVRQALELSIDREAINQVVFNGEFKPGNQWVNPEHPYYQKAFPVPKRDVAKAKALLKEAGVTRRSASTSWCRRARRRGRRAGDPVDGGGSRLRHEDPGHRVRDLAEAGRGRRIPGLS